MHFHFAVFALPLHFPIDFTKTFILCVFVDLERCRGFDDFFHWYRIVSHEVEV